MDTVSVYGTFWHLRSSGLLTFFAQLITAAIEYATGVCSVTKNRHRTEALHSFAMPESYPERFGAGAVLRVAGSGIALPFFVMLKQKRC